MSITWGNTLTNSSLRYSQNVLFPSRATSHFLQHHLLTLIVPDPFFVWGLNPFLLMGAPRDIQVGLWTLLMIPLLVNMYSWGNDEKAFLKYRGIVKVIKGAFY